MRPEIKDAIYDLKASEHSRNAIFFWLMVGIGWLILDKEAQLFGMLGLLLFFPGIFIASFVSMPLFLLRNKIALETIEKGRVRLLILIPLLNLFDLIEMLSAPILYVAMLKGLV